MGPRMNVWFFHSPAPNLELIVGQVVDFDGTVDLRGELLDAGLDVHFAVDQALSVVLHQLAALGEHAQQRARVFGSGIMQLIDRNLELRILLDVLLEGLQLVGGHGDREVAGLRAPEGLLLGRDHELDEFPGRVLARFVAGVERPQGAAANGHAALIVGIDGREVANADLEVVANVGQQGLQRRGGFQGHRDVAGDERGLGVVVALVEVGIAFVDVLLPDVQDRLAGAVLVEDDLRGRSFAAAVVVIDVVQAHLAGPLLEEQP